MPHSSPQIYHVANPFVSAIPNIRLMLLVGGSDVAVDLKKVNENGVNIIVGTPGRIADIMERSSLELKLLEVFFMYFLIYILKNLK